MKDCFGDIFKNNAHGLKISVATRNISAATLFNNNSWERSGKVNKFKYSKSQQWNNL